MSVKQLFETLRSLALRQPALPDCYTFTARFWSALQPDIQNWLFKLQINDTSGLSKIYKAAVGFEQSKTFANVAGTTRAGKSNKEKDKERETTKTASTSKTTEEARPSSSNKNNKKKKVGFSKDTSNWNSRLSESRSAPSSSTFVPTCHHCNKKGHYKNECPDLKGKSYVKAKVAQVETDAKSSGEEVSNLDHENGSDSEYNGAHYNADARHAESETETSNSVTARMARIVKLTSESESEESNVAIRFAKVVPWVDESTLDICAAKAVTTHEHKSEYEVTSRACYKKGVEQPYCSPASMRCMEGIVKIGGIECHALWDTGCTTCMISPDLAKIAHVNMFKLEKPIGLQMAVSGSQSSINQGAHAPLTIKGFSEPMQYYDIVNNDQYNLVLGTPFMWENKCVISFVDDRKISVTNPAGETFLFKNAAPLVADAAKPRKKSSGSQSFWK